MEDERVVGFKSEYDIWNHIEDLGSRSFIIIFNKGSGNDSSKFDYTIKSKSNRFMTDRHYSKNLNAVAKKATNEYVNDGFLGIQYGLDTTFYETTAGNSEIPYVIQVERMPSLSQDPLASVIDSLGLFIIIFSALICIALIFTRMVEEKTCGFREQLKNATRFSYLNNFALFTTNHFQMMILFIICLFVTYIKGVWFSVNFFYPLLLTFLYITSLITFTFLVSAFFESSKINVLKLNSFKTNLYNNFSRILNGWCGFLVLCTLLLLSARNSPMEKCPHHVPHKRILSRDLNFPRLHELWTLLLPPKFLSKITPQRWCLCNG